MLLITYYYIFFGNLSIYIDIANIIIMSRIIILSSSLLLTSYTTYIYNLNNDINDNRFVIGSADDIVRDNLHTGDIILFHRRW